MANVHLRRVSAYCPGLLATLGALGAGCIADERDAGDGEAVISAAVTIDTTSGYSLIGVQSNKCVAVVGDSTASLARTEIRTCSGLSNQRFHPEAAGGGFFRLRNELSGLCLDVEGESTADGAAVIQFSCHTGLNQQWSFTDVAPGAERLTVRHSGKVLDVTGDITSDGTLVEQWTSNNGTNQQFTLLKAVPSFAPR